MPTLWYGKQATVKIGDAWDTISTNTDLETDFGNNANGTDFSAEVTDFTFTDPEADVSALNVFGSQVKEESRPDLVNVDFTMVFSDVDMFEHLHGAATQISTSSFYRISGGDQTGSRPDKAILFKLSDGSNQINVLLNNAWFTSGGEVSLAADGRAEWSGTAVCLVSDRYIEDDIS